MAFLSVRREKLPPACPTTALAPEPSRPLFAGHSLRSVSRALGISRVTLRGCSYPRYLFSNESTKIHGIGTSALEEIGVHWTASRDNVVSVARHDDVARLDRIVGPKSYSVSFSDSVAAVRPSGRGRAAA
jgi:hypothetical protein